jgi:hypothetical protein
LSHNILAIPTKVMIQLMLALSPSWQVSSDAYAASERCFYSDPVDFKQLAAIADNYAS